MKVLLSIKPEFVERIFSGEKKFEFRRSIFKNKEIVRVIIYASSPIKKVVGEFEISEILLDTIDSLWNKTSTHAGIEKEYFLKYFENRDKGFAIKIKSIKKYKNPFCISQLGKKPPQSFVYVN